MKVPATDFRVCLEREFAPGFNCGRNASIISGKLYNKSFCICDHFTIFRIVYALVQCIYATNSFGDMSRLAT